ncbi:hypothetical protein ESZ50_11390, partial [Weissella muntiaci]
FNDPYIKIMRNTPGIGDTLAIIYLEMLVLSAESDGYIYFKGAGQDIAEELALELNEDPEAVRILIAYLDAKNLIAHPNNDDVFLVASADMTGSETSSARRVRAFRERQALHSNGDVTLGNDSKSKNNSNTESKKQIESESKTYIESENILSSNAVAFPDWLSEKQVESVKKGRADNYLVKIPIAYLNQIAGKQYKFVEKSTKLVHARLAEGFALNDFKIVIDTKVAEWINDANMNKYLRPETLFGNKFESYLNQTKSNIPDTYGDEYSSAKLGF